MQYKVTEQNLDSFESKTAVAKHALHFQTVSPNPTPFVLSSPVLIQVSLVAMMREDMTSSDFFAHEYVDYCSERKSLIEKWMYGGHVLLKMESPDDQNPPSLL